MRQVPQFSVRELSSVIGELKNMKCGDDINVAAEMLNHVYFWNCKLYEFIISIVALIKARSMSRATKTNQDAC